MAEQISRKLEAPVSVRLVEIHCAGKLAKRGVKFEISRITRYFVVAKYRAK